MINKIIGILFFLVLSCTFCYADGWEQDFTESLQLGKQAANSEPEELYEEIILERAIKKAIEEEGPPCEVMKIAIDLKYNAYYTIKNIYNVGGMLDIDELCMCATESGIAKQIIAQAAVDAISSAGTPVYGIDEIAQAQCINKGLGYTEALDAPSLIEMPSKPTSYLVSPSAP